MRWEKGQRHGIIKTHIPGRCVCVQLKCIVSIPKHISPCAVHPFPSCPKSGQCCRLSSRDTSLLMEGHLWGSHILEVR